MAKKKLTYLMLASAVLLLLSSAVGSTRAALTYYSENYVAKITVSRIIIRMSGKSTQIKEPALQAANCFPICWARRKSWL